MAKKKRLWEVWKEPKRGNWKIRFPWGVATIRTHSEKTACDLAEMLKLNYGE